MNNKIGIYTSIGLITIVVMVVLWPTLSWSLHKNKPEPNANASTLTDSQLAHQEAMGGVYSWCGRVYDFGQSVPNMGFETGTPGVTEMNNLSRPSSYIPLSMTCKPYGFPNATGPLKQWQNSEKWWAQEYAPSQLETVIAKVQTYRKNNNMSGSPAITGAVSEVADSFYTDAERYCRYNPAAYPCPNFWLAQSGQSSLMLQPDKTYTKPLPKGDFSHIKDSQIDDNYSTFVVKPGGDDQALCGNAACFRPTRPACGLKG